MPQWWLWSLNELRQRLVVISIIQESPYLLWMSLFRILAGELVWYPLGRALRRARAVDIFFFLSFCSHLKTIFSIAFREKKGEREKHQCERETLAGCLPYVPGLGIMHALTGDRTCNLSVMGGCSIQLRHTGQGTMGTLLQEVFDEIITGGRKNI